MTARGKLAESLWKTR